MEYVGNGVGGGGSPTDDIFIDVDVTYLSLYDIIYTRLTGDLSTMIPPSFFGSRDLLPWEWLIIWLKVYSTYFIPLSAAAGLMEIEYGDILGRWLRFDLIALIRV